VERAPDATAFHLLGWRRVVERSFGHPAHYLTALADGRITGVLPLFELRSLLFGRSLISLPFAIGGGVVAEDRAAAEALLAAAKGLAERLRVDYLELRSEKPAAPDLATKDLYVTFRADLDAGEEALLRRMERKRRQMMTYAGKAGFTLRIAAADELPLFHGLFARSMRRHGTPVYPRRFLAEVLAQYPGRANLAFVEHQGRAVAGVLSLLFRGVLMPFYAGSEDGERVRGVDDFLYLELMRWGRQHGFHTFDFGRSKRGTGPYKFKTWWGMEEVPLAYQYHLVRARELPNVSPANPRYERAIRLWRRLPLPVTKLVGPWIVRRVP
ncbi:MAG TPA: FemAB family XrtA/PEP-CTERM system-associated protein, partial [Thermoanaerobaculia bacterium]|nr:FemAB family XrtA/PEP-CTERM system-associated protein [Thermoanaerobaculia bacterium]